ncbi:MAG: DNA polymerase III subunit beta [Candidatus Omnitrophica bacterium]|nr:DNA polymerase III subunit beta [Candidatus Omnitrophota bacterium]MCF7892173.1 DNA polymerase III subunit beta [Candidatus Omnitrophota bacterium]MCF7895988.1 DNA polymerase III subunit beta [Candidatus Omnitrophota bacterium]MCF7897427.1 DNA polymerase III subunit beta [Candidatus Omnitrophota bacterium]
MNLIIDRRDLVESLKSVIGPTTTKQDFLALGSVLITAEKDQVKFITTDLDLTITTQTKGDIKSAGKVLVPMRRFISIARELPDAKISLEKAKNILLIRCENVEFKINTLKEEEFPRIQEKKEAVTVKMLPEVIEEMIRLTSFCAGYEDVNYVLSGVLFEIEGSKIKLVATDGKRLSCVTREFPDNQAEVEEKIDFILPNKAVGEIARITKEKQNPFYLSFSKKNIEFDFKETKIIARLIEGEFPNYSQYIPKQRGNQLKVNKNNFMASLRRVGLLTTTEYQGVKLNLKKNKMVVYKTTPQLGEAKEEINTKYQGPGLDVEFNPNYFIDVLKQINDQEITIDFFGSEKPAVIKRENHTYLLLPMKT